MRKTLRKYFSKFDKEREGHKKTEVNRKTVWMLHN